MFRLQVISPLRPLPASVRPHHTQFLSRSTRNLHRYPAATTPNSTMEETKKSDVVGEVVAPSFVNKPWVRAIGVLSTLWVASRYVSVPLSFTRMIHFFSFSGWFGCTLWVLLLSPMIMFRALTRQTFGKLQAKLFPQFFGFSATALLLMTATTPLKGVPYILIGTFLVNALNWLWVEPKVTGLIMQRYDLENMETRDEEKISALRKTSSKYHGISSMLGMTALLLGTTHGVFLSSLFTL